MKESQRLEIQGIEIGMTGIQGTEMMTEIEIGIDMAGTGMIEDIGLVETGMIVQIVGQVIVIEMITIETITIEMKVVVGMTTEEETEAGVGMITMDTDIREVDIE